MSCVSGLITACASYVCLALLDQLAAKGFGYDATLMEVGHELPRDLQLQASILSHLYAAFQ